MRKLTLVFGLLVAVAISSCSKEKDCKCVTTAPGVPEVTTTVTIEDGKCSDMNTSTGIQGMMIETTCTEQ